VQQHMCVALLCLTPLAPLRQQWQHTAQCLCCTACWGPPWAAPAAAAAFACCSIVVSWTYPAVGALECPSSAETSCSFPAAAAADSGAVAPVLCLCTELLCPLSCHLITNTCCAAAAAAARALR
jgi:hypothetical protein